jgi:hypothetical protein
VAGCAPFKETHSAITVPCRSCLAFLLLSAISLMCSGEARSQNGKPSEYQVKAVYLYNFSRFVEWPSEAPALKTSSFEICVLGRDPFGPALDATVAGENVDGKSVVARRISKPEEGLDCRVLFLSASEDNHLKTDLTVFEKVGVLTVSDMPHFSQRGGMIQFVTDGDKVRFEVNLSNANDSGLSLSSDLLKLAIAVRKNS